MQNFGTPGTVNIPQHEVKLYDNPHGVEIYAEGVHNLFANSGNVTLALYCTRSSSPGTNDQVYRSIVGRVTLPVAAAQVLAETLFGFLKQSGLSPDANAPKQ